VRKQKKRPQLPGLDPGGDASERERLAREIQRLRKETEQQAAELAVINSVQSALAARLDIQGIYDAVGDRLHEIFSQADVGIAIYDHETNLLHIPYDYESGQRTLVASFPLKEQGFLAHVLRTQEPLFINENIEQEMKKYGSYIITGTVPDKSLVYVPLIVGDQARGVIAIKDSQHEHAFNDSDVRLLTTIANSMSVALENAHLFEETQRLLKETEQRNAELAIINSLAEAMAKTLNVKTVTKLVGDKVRDIFDSDIVGIRLLEPSTNLIQPIYTYDRVDGGYQDYRQPFPLNKGLTSTIMQSRRPLLLGTLDEQLAHGVYVPPELSEKGSGVLSESWLGVPIIVNDKVLGVVIISDYRQHAYNESHLRLLQTLAANMGVAIENAGLFEEVQKQNAEITEALERETASNDILRVIAGSPTDIQPVLEVIARHAAQLSGSEDVIITLREGDMLHVDAHYGEIPTFSVGEGLRFNRDSVAGRAILDGRPVQGIHNQPGVKAEFPEGDQAARKYGYRLTCAVPLLREGQAIGAISIRRLKPELLTEKQIALVQSFASQAVIAIENVRLFNELQKRNTEITEALEQQTATSEILSIIAENPTDVQPVLDAVAERAAKICNSYDAAIAQIDGNTYEAVAHWGPVPISRLGAVPLNRDTVVGRAMVDRKTLHIHDLLAEPPGEFELSKEFYQISKQRTLLVTPLMRENQVIGSIMIRRQEVNPFTDKQVALLKVFADQAAIAIENVRLFNETTRLLKETEQRAAELQIINSIQQGLAAELDFQAIVNLVGDKLCAVLNTGDLCIRWYDEKTNLLYFLYEYEHGERLTIAPMAPPKGSTFETILRTRQPILWNTPADYSSGHLPGTDQSRSLLAIPILSSDHVLGAINIENYEREHAFGNSELRLLTTIAASLGTALENARLFDETQRLLKETEQRNAELAIINSVQAGLASRLDIQGIYDLVGEKLSEIFDSPAVFISHYDLVANRVDYPYYSVERKHISLEPRPLSGAALEMIRTRQPVFLQHDAEKRLVEEYKMSTIPGTPDAESYLLMPMIVGSQVKGGIGVMSTDRQHPLGDSSVRLLQTITSSMSVALENARLFDETQRLLKQTEQRNAELAIINSVQEGLASKLDMQAIYDLVGDKIRDLLNAGSVWIITFDPAARTRRVRYSFENGQRYYPSESFPYNKLVEHLITTKKPLVINQDFTEAIARFEMIDMAGTQEQIKSIAYIPITAGEDVTGFISLPNSERENAFSESDINLLSTFAASMSIALENIRLFDETRRLLKETERANQAKSAFLSSMSHELRTPLNAIINFVEMVARGMLGPVNQEQVDILDQALHSSKHLLNLINDVLDISKIQAGQLTLYIEEGVSVQVEVEAALSIVGGLLQEKGLRLIRDIDPHLPPVACDRRRVRQVLLNLISNAIKFTQQGSVTVSVKDQGGEVLFAVIDTGPGIPPEEHEVIFEPFLQAENGEKQVQGTGLGLPISRSLVRAHGGELWVESQRGEGSAFFFTLPVAPLRGSRA
jgi:GAF domain-containing protein